jgi:hypothetical protein
MDGIIWWNCGGSLKGKIESIKYHINKFNPLIMFITEADSKMMDIRLIGIENFDLITPTNIIGERFRNAAYVRSDFKVSQIEMSSPNVIGIKIRRANPREKDALANRTQATLKNVKTFLRKVNFRSEKSSLKEAKTSSKLLKKQVIAFLAYFRLATC